MLTAILAGATLLLGMVVLALAARARTRSDCLRMGVLALAYSLLSAVVLAIQMGPSSLAAGSPAAPNESVPFIGSLSLGLLIALYCSVRSRRLARPPRSGSLGSDNLWQEIIHATTANSSLDEMLFSVAAILRRATSSQAAHVFKISRTRRRALRIGTVALRSAAPAGTPSGMHYDRGKALNDLAWRAAGQFDLAIAPPGATKHPVAVAIPFGSDGTVLTVVVLDQALIDVFDADVRRTLMGIGALVGRTVVDWTEATISARFGRLCDNLRHMIPALGTTDRFERGLKVIAAGLEGVCDVDYLSIAWLDRSRFHENRVSMLLADGDQSAERMLENRRRWPISDNQIQRVLALRRALVTPDLQMASVDGPLDGGEPWECRLGMRSRLIVPILDSEEIRGTITVAHRRVAFYGESEIHVMAVIADVLSLWLRGLEGTRDADRLRDVETFIQRLHDGVDVWTDDTALLQDAKDLIDVSGMRLFRYDSADRTMAQVAAAGRVGRRTTVGPLSIDRLPWHRWALDSGRLLQIDQGDPESLMPSSETESTLAAGVKTGCVVPITAGGRWLGALNVLEMRDPDRSRLDRMDRLLLSSLASALANRWTNGDAIQPAAGQRTADVASNATRELHRSIVNPLTSIIGSAELIRHKQPDLSPETIKYLKTIEQSATRVHESVTSFMARLVESPDPVHSRQDRNAGDDGYRTRSGDQMTERTVLTRPASFSDAHNGGPYPDSDAAPGLLRGHDTGRFRMATVSR